MTIQHKDIPNAQLHEVKGANTASFGQLLRGGGDGTTSFWTPDYTRTRMGFWDYNHGLASPSVIISAAGTPYQLMNDGTGPNTNTSFGLPGVTNIFNTSTGYFDFSSLKIGDTVDFRIDADITTSAANVVTSLTMELGIGTTPYTLTMSQDYFKTAGVHTVTPNVHIYIGNNTTRAGLARFMTSSDTAASASVKIRGWFIRVISNG